MAHRSSRQTTHGAGDASADSSAAAAASVAPFDTGTVVSIGNGRKFHFLELHPSNNGHAIVACIYGGQPESIELSQLKPSGLYDGLGSRSGLIRGQSRPILSRNDDSGNGNGSVPAPGTSSLSLAARSVTPPRSGLSQHSSNQSNLPAVGQSIYSRFQTACIVGRSFVAGRKGGKENIHPLASFILKNKKKSKAWLRNSLPFKTDKKQMNERERTAMVISFSLITGLDCNSGVYKGLSASFAHAWGVTDRLVRSGFDSIVERGFVLARKERNDKGESIFTSESRRQQVFTALREYAKDRRHGLRAELDPLTNAEIKDDFDALPEERQTAYKNRAEANLIRARTLHHELIEVMKRTGCTLTFLEISAQLSNIVDESTVRRYRESHDDFRMVATRILPHLNQAAKEKRVVYCHSFWIFWESARCLSSNV